MNTNELMYACLFVHNPLFVYVYAVYWLEEWIMIPNPPVYQMTSISTPPFRLWPTHWNGFLLACIFITTSKDWKRKEQISPDVRDSHVVFIVYSPTRSSFQNIQVKFVMGFLNCWKDSRTRFCEIRHQNHIRMIPNPLVYQKTSTSTHPFRLWPMHWNGFLLVWIVITISNDWKRKDQNSTDVRDSHIVFIVCSTRLTF